MAIGNMIPFFGPIVAALVTYLIGMIGLGPVNALWILVFQFVLGQIDGNIIQPKIVGSQVGVSPLLVLVSVTVFGGSVSYTHLDVYKRQVYVNPCDGLVIPKKENRIRDAMPSELIPVINQFCVNYKHGDLILSIIHI